MIARNRASFRDVSWLLRASGGQLTHGGAGAGAMPVAAIRTDTREVGRGDCFVALVGARVDAHTLVGQAFAAGAAGVIVQRPLPPRSVPRGRFAIRVADTGAALLDLARAWRVDHEHVPVVGITGSCGKTSTKNMLGRILQRNVAAVVSPHSYNNRVGVPLTLFGLRPDTRAAVVEIGTSAPGEIAALAAIARPDIGIVTCVAESHLEGLGSLEGVAREKASLLRALPAEGVAIVNADDPATARHMQRATRARRLTVSTTRRADWFATDVRFCGLGTSFLLGGRRPVTLPLLGSHNVVNALFALAAARELGVELDAAVEALADMPAGERRLQCLQIGDVQLFDDTYNMNPLSARAALLALAGIPGGGRRVVVFGEMLELGPASAELHRELGAEVARRGTDQLVTVGAGAEPIAAGALAAGMRRTRVRVTRDQGEALDVLTALVRAGDRVLCKASHGVALDRLVHALVEALRQRAAAQVQVQGSMG